MKARESIIVHKISWADTFKYAVDLSRKHSRKTGSRALDILHVASALSIKADRFFTFDERQSKLVSLTGIMNIAVKSNLR